MTTPTPLTAEEEADFDKRLAIGSDEYLTVFEQRRLLDAARAGGGPETGWRTPDDLIDELNATRQKLGDCEDALTTVETAYEVLDAARAGAVGSERPTAYRLSAMLEEMQLAGVTDPFDKRDRAALAALGYVHAARAGEGLREAARQVEALTAYHPHEAPYVSGDASLPCHSSQCAGGMRAKVVGILRAALAATPPTEGLDNGSEYGRLLS